MTSTVTRMISGRVNKNATVDFCPKNARTREGDRACLITGAWSRTAICDMDNLGELAAIPGQLPPVLASRVAHHSGRATHR
jgi:hypothetical protein